MQLRAAEREMADQQHSRTLAQSSSLFNNDVELDERLASEASEGI